MYPSPLQPFWPYFGATGEFSGISWLIGTVFVLRNFLTLTLVGFSQFFWQFAIYWFLPKEGDDSGPNLG